MTRILVLIALILGLVTASPSLSQRAPIRRIDLPSGVSFLDLLQAWKAQQQFPSIKLIPGLPPSSPGTGVLYMDQTSGRLMLHRNGSFHVIVTEADLRGALMQASDNGVDAGAWSRINFIGAGVTVNVTNGQLDVTIPDSGGGGGGDGTPPGTVLAYAGQTAPAGYLFCNGQQVSRTAYANLYAAIGTTYGVGNGSTTFTLPDLRGRTIFGRENMGGAAYVGRLASTISSIEGTTLGFVGGISGNVLTAAMLPAHTHTIAYTLSGLGIGTLKVGVDGGAAGTFATGSVGAAANVPNVPPMMILNWMIRY